MIGRLRKNQQRKRGKRVKKINICSILFSILILLIINSEVFALDKKIEIIIRQAFQNGMYYALLLDEEEYKSLKNNLNNTEKIEDKIAYYTNKYIEIVEELSSEKSEKK